jgi:hypothetical protein
MLRVFAGDDHGKTVMKVQGAVDQNSCRAGGDALETLRLARADLAGRATPALLAMLLGAEAASLTGATKGRSTVSVSGDLSSLIAFIAAIAGHR